MIGGVFKTHVGAWVWILALPGHVVLSALGERRAWSGDVTWTSGMPGNGVFLVGVVLAGAVAVDVARATQPARRHLVAMAPRGRSPRLLAVLVALLPVLAVQALVWGVMMAWSARGPHDFPALPAHFLDLGVQLLALCALAGLGYAAGALLGPIAAGLAAAAAAFALLAGYVAVPGAMLRPFFVIGDGSPRLGFVPHLGFGGVQAVLLLVLACALFAVPGQVSRTKKAPWRAAACGALVIGCLVAPAWVDAGPYRMVTSNASDCRGSSPVVCDYAESAERRFVYEESVRTLVAAAREVGYDSLAPDHVHMVVDSSPPAGDAAMFTMTTQSFFDPHAPGTVAGIIDVAGVLITPRHCDQLYQDVWPPDAYWQATDTLMVTWLDLVGVDRSEIGMLDESIEPVGPHESAELVEALGSCDPSLLGPLP